VAQFLIQPQAGHPRLHRDGQVLGIDAQDGIHAGQIQTDAAAHRQQMALQRGAGAVGNDRDAVRRGRLKQRGNLVGVFGPDHRIGRHGIKGRFVATVLQADRRGGRAA